VKKEERGGKSREAQGRRKSEDGEGKSKMEVTGREGEE
jgi:hypothetical protein